MYSSILLIIISVFMFSFFFKFLDRPSKKKKITMSDFYQEVTFKQYFFTSPSSLCSCVLIVYLSVSLSFFSFVFFFVCVWGGG